jgi:dolichyl-phosphate-mannose-protein mannosyltransferase
VSIPEPVFAYERPLVVVEPVEETGDLPAPPPESDSVLPGRWARLLPGAGPVFAVVMLCAILSRVVWLSLPANSLIFDEAYYVNAARVIDGFHVPTGAAYANEPTGRDPNREHPPLGKVLIAASMRVFGDDALGWRLPSLIAGIAAILLVFAIVRAAGGDAWLGVLASALFAFDNLALVHSRIGTLDMMLVALLLLGAWFALQGRPILAGIGCALAALVKITGAYGVLALIIAECVMAVWVHRREGRWPAERLRASLMLLASFVVVWFVGLWLLDARFSSYRFPWDHLQYILHYGFDLTRASGPQGQESYPWQWLINDVQMTYFRSDQQVMANGQVLTSRALIYFRGAMNPVIIGAAPLGVAFTLVRVWRQHDRLALWAIAWIAAMYLPFYPLAMLEHRISYLFYFLPTLPAVTIALAIFLRHGGLPRLVVWCYLAMVLVGFIGYFPFRAIP